MTECLSIPCVTTTPKPFGVNVEWKWPDLSFWGSQLELQYLLADDRLVKEVISWPVTGLLISGLKADERLQVRLRPVRADGSTRDWCTGDWIDAVTSADAQEIADYVLYSLKDASPFAIKDGEVFIKDAFIGNGITTTNWSMKVNADENGHRSAGGVGIAVNNEATKTRLSDDMREAVIDAIRESDVFRALQASQDAQASALVTAQRAIERAATNAVRNALKPGGLLYSRGR